MGQHAGGPAGQDDVLQLVDFALADEVADRLGGNQGFRRPDPSFGSRRGQSLIDNPLQAHGKLESALFAVVEGNTSTIR